MQIRCLDTTQNDFTQQLDALLAYESVADEAVIETVRHILKQVKQRGDEAVLEFSNKFDRLNATSMTSLEIAKERLALALDAIPVEQKEALIRARERIEAYHLHQVGKSWQYTEADGSMLGQQITPLDRVGLYVPGGKAAYPSSVLMNAVPAKVAGVAELIMVVPTPDGVVNDMVLAAAAVAGVDRVFTIGGAQAVAALAYGTQTIPKVDKIVGPGNIYVAMAKGMLFGQVGIDMIAGPSEILVVCDGKTDPDWIAMDLFSQAEHDEDAQSILLCDDADYIEQVKQSMLRLVADMPRAEIIRKAIEQRGALIKTQNLAQSIELINRIAPEHLELSVEDPQALLPSIRHAGAIFMGRYTAEALGDYCAGPNHVLPTSGTARFSSPLGVYDFQKRSSLIMCSALGAADLGQTASVLAYGEGLQAHGRSADYRRKNNK